jgi:hypothetical protein
MLLQATRSKNNRTMVTDSENMAKGSRAGGKNFKNDIQLVQLLDGKFTANSMPGAQLQYDEKMFAYKYTSGGTLDFPSAWIATRKAVEALEWDESRIDIEENIFCITLQKGLYQHQVYMTLDFFDFWAAHLSFWVDFTQIRNNPMHELDPRQQLLWRYLQDRLNADMERLWSPLPASDADSDFYKYGVAVFAYASSRYKDGGVDSPALLFANVTFWSLQRQFQRVIVGSCSDEDYEAVSTLPVWRHIKLQGGSCKTNSGKMLLDYVAQTLQRKTDDSHAWEDVKYIYFTEGDLILGLRKHREMQQLVDAEQVIVPHRFEAYPVRSDFPSPQMRSIGLPFMDPSFDSQMIDVSPDTSSCCLSGRILACAEFWWMCHAPVNGNASLFPFITAARFSDGGLPIGLATHGGGPVDPNGRGSQVTTGPETCQVCRDPKNCPCLNPK